MVLTALEGVPFIQPGDNLVEIILEALEQSGLELMDGDLLVLAQKIVSKSEDRFINLKSVHPSGEAVELAGQTGKDARLIEIVLQESERVLRVRPGVIIVKHRLGFVCANAGVDHSNVSQDEQGDRVLLLPENPDGSAARIRAQILAQTGVPIGILIIDSFGRAWRNGTVGTAIGLSGLTGLLDLRGKPDLYGEKLKITRVGLADELAAAASVLMGEADEARPIVHIRGIPYLPLDGSLAELLRPESEDLFL
ncbi:MAG: coenzyme F420-0:L-glutamate ligase [Anaerolineales bacterium]|nr:coenzyme F420-0:L-glutamate ligase [Anaerolineales bacterium]